MNKQQERRNPSRARGIVEHIEVDGYHSNGAMRFRVVVNGQTLVTCNRSHGSGKFRKGDVVVYSTTGTRASGLAFAK